jgi:acetyl-CoA synthetase
MYWIGLEPGDVHLNISSPGWAKHAWSNIFAAVERRRHGVDLEVMGRVGVSSFCAPPTV